MRNKVVKVLLSILLAIGVIFCDIKVLDQNNKPCLEDASKAVLAEMIEFHINDLKNDLNKYTISYDKVKDADKYQVKVLDEENTLVISESEDDIIGFTLPIESLNYGKTYFLNFEVFKGENIIYEDSTKSIVWKEPSISNTNKKSMNNKKYTLKIDGRLSKNYYLVIKSGEKILYKKKITKNKFVVPTKYYKNKSVTLEFILYKGKTSISSFQATNKMKKKKITTTKASISAVKISNPSYTKLTEIKNVDIEFTGGDNAKDKYIYIYENGKRILKDNINSNKYTIPSKTFKQDKMYTIKVEATSGSSKKSSKITISTIKDARMKMVELAKKQLGNGGKKYWNWYGYGFAVEWCAVFVSYISGNNGYIDAGIIPKFSGCGSGVKWFKQRNRFKLHSSGYKAQPGDIIFFDYEPENSVINHVGIVEYVDSEGNVHTIEGNIENDNKLYSKVSRRVWYKDDFRIYGYGVPNY